MFTISGCKDEMIAKPEWQELSFFKKSYYHDMHNWLINALFQESILSGWDKVECQYNDKN